MSLIYLSHKKNPNIDEIIQTLQGTSTILVLEIITTKANFTTLLKEN